MSLRKVAGLLMAFGLVFGLIGSGVGASFLDTVTATQNLQVGTFGCAISSTEPGVVLGNYVNGYAHSVSYSTDVTASTGSAPFDFSVTSTGSIPVQITLTQPVLTSPWFNLLVDPGAQNLTAAGHPGDSYTYHAGLAWAGLTNTDLGTNKSATWTVNCGEVVSTAIFDNHPATLPSNLPSYGPEAYAYNEWGGGVTFDGTARKLATSTVTMSSWACQTGSWNTNNCVSAPGSTFNVPITFNVYNVAGSAVGTLITSRTQTFAIPYRPSADLANCTGGNLGKWFDGTTCKSGLANNITFTFPAGTTLPNTAIFGITFNTDNFGYAHIGGSGAFTDSLNIATYPATGVSTPALVGSWLPNDVQTYLSTGSVPSPFIGSSLVSNMPTNVSDDFVGYMPAVQITATN